MDNCLQPVLTAAWQKHRLALFEWDKKKIIAIFLYLSANEALEVVEILLAFSPFTCLHHPDATRHWQCAQN
ncbi:hypothetical protein SF123566_10451 [Shigella flexneri 1235-66]|nr:hypothetical protein SF123566_10451 [Shigella flexneri 1235-66]